MINIKPISISLSPNMQGDDIFLALKLLARMITPPHPPLVREGIALEDVFREYLNTKYAFSFNSGRSALYVILKALELKSGDEVLLQAFTCNAVPNPVIWAGGKPVYVDIDDTLNIDPVDLEKKITLRQAQGKLLRAVIIQNTFGVPAQIDKILEIARRHNLMVIEDCAHALGAKFNNRLLGAFGDIAFFSFGRDKVISSVWGGMITTNNKNLADKISSIYKDLPYPSKFWTFKQLLHPVLFSIIIPSYYIFGKYFLAFLRVARGIGLAVSREERMGEMPDMFPARLPEAFATLALHQFGKLEKYNAHRKKIAELYLEELSGSDPDSWGGLTPIVLPMEKEGAIYLRFNIRHPNAREIIKKAKQNHVLLGDWYKNVIDPVGTDFEKMGYTPGSCPKAEIAANESINLPTHINISGKNAQSIIDFLKNKNA